MIDIDFERLRSIGLTPALAQGIQRQLAAGEEHEQQEGGRAPPRPFRVVQVHRETVHLHDGVREHSARVQAPLWRALLLDDDLLAVGDWVLAAPDPHGDLWVVARVPAASRLTRRDGEGFRHVVVANVDTALLVMGLDLDFNVRRLERYLAVLHGTGITPVAVLTKKDIIDRRPGALQQALDQLRGRLPTHLDVVPVDATAAGTADLLAPYVSPGQTVVLLGSSGTGKSTLTNTLMGEDVQDTGAARVHDSRGKHTTTARTLFRLPGGACIIDTPGLRTLQPDTDQASVSASFADIHGLAPSCRFRDCTHTDEPGCAVRTQVDPDRLRNYQKLMRETRRDTMTALDRRNERARWKVINRGASLRARQKRGESR